MQTEIPIPQAELTNVSDLKTDGKNPNRMTKEQHERLATSIKKYGFIVPIITNKDLLIADGEQRWTVAKSLGMKEVSVIRLPVEEVDRRLLRQVLNKLRGEHELLLDAEEFEAIIELGRKDDLKYLLDLTDGKLERYLNELHPANDEEFEIPEIDKIKTEIKNGDIYKLGNNRLMCGDSTKQEDIKQLCEKEVDLVCTDPPYRLDKAFFGTTGAKYASVDSDKVFPVSAWFQHLKTVVKKDSSVLIFENWINSPEVWTEVAKEYKVENVIIWHATNRHYMWFLPKHFPNRYDICVYGHKGQSIYNVQTELSDVVVHPVANEKETGSKIHFGSKPLAILTPYIQALTNQDSIVLDLFGGSGSTLIACEQTGRTCYMMEIDPRYCEIICQRWEKYTGQKRKLVVSGENNV